MARPATSAPPAPSATTRRAPRSTLATTPPGEPPSASRGAVDVAEREGEMPRQRADDGVGLAVQAEALAEGGDIAAELAQPEGVAQHGHALGASRVVGVVQQAARRLQAQQIEAVRRHPQALEALGGVGRREGGAPVAVPCRLEAPYPPAKVHELRQRERASQRPGCTDEVHTPVANPGGFP
jgi:hypothetical protein